MKRGLPLMGRFWGIIFFEFGGGLFITGFKQMDYMGKISRPCFEGNQRFKFAAHTRFAQTRRNHA